jgi:CMP-N,N'-diacetyllegionaminic acid synthase
MIKGLKVIALIPARGNSKGINRKNLLLFNGSTLLEHVIINAKESKTLDKIFVNSEDSEILEKAKKHGVNIFKRDLNLAQDKVTANEVIKNFIQNFEFEIDYFILYLQPTSPLRTTEHINSICELIENSLEDCALSVTEIDNKILKSFLIVSGKLVPVSNESFINSNRQDLPPVYLSNGAAYLFRKSDFMRADMIPIKNAIPFVMDESESIDIDSIEDYKNLLKIDYK